METILLGIAGTLILILLAIIGFLIKNKLRDTQKLNETIQTHTSLRLGNHEDRISDNEDDITKLKIKTK